MEHRRRDITVGALVGAQCLAVRASNMVEWSSRIGPREVDAGLFEEGDKPNSAWWPRTIIFVILLNATLPSLPAHAQAPTYDLVLRNARIIDGSGKPAYRSDVAIRGDTIVRIARSITDPAMRVIDVRS